MNQPIGPIPETLIDQLHRASEQFHDRRIALEKAMDASEYRHQERVNIAQVGLQQAERAVEDVEEEIKKLFAQEREPK